MEAERVGVLMQAFYWNCPAREGRDGTWWTFVTERIAELNEAGFTALWLPPVSKAANLGGPSMGYDPYDYYDLGDIDQKGRIKTWFGNGTELRELIERAHQHNMQVYADMVLDHNSGGDRPEHNPLDEHSRWTLFSPGSTRFPRTWECFHPSPYETFDEMTFGEMPDLCHRNPYVYTELIKFAQWMVEDVGFDGFRFDFVKGYGPWMVKALAEMRYLNKTDRSFKPFFVGECWDNERTINDWLNTVNAFIDNPIHAFDFPLRYRLKDLCDQFGFSLRTLAQGGTLLAENSARAVTFVDNHDTTQKEEDGVINDKLLAYAFILTHEGYPSVFWQDYYNYGLARTGTQNGIAALVHAHERHAGGASDVLYSDDDLYLMQRTGHEGQSGLVLVINNHGDAWKGAGVSTRWTDTRLAPVAWSGHSDQSEPEAKWTDAHGRAELWAAPRGYAVYAPQRP